MSAAGAGAALRQAWTALQSGRPDEARALCEQAIATAPAGVDAWRMLAMARQQLGDAAGAEAALARAAALRPDDAAIAFELGSVRLQRGDADGAIAPLRAAMAGLPAEPRAAFRYGTAAFVLGRFDAAVDGFAAATARDPQWVEAWNNLAAAHGRRQQFPPAIAAARAALALRPDAAGAHQALAALLSNLFDRESLEQGLAHALRAIALDPALAEAHRNAAVLLRKLGEPARAEAHARQARALAPDDADTVDTLGEQLLLNQRPADAAATYAAAIARGVDRPALRRQHGIALLQDRRAAEAVVALDDALRRQPDDQRTIAHLALALAADGRDRDGLDLLGLHRHVHAVALEPPPQFADAAAFHAALADDIRRHSQQRWEPAGLAARNAFLSGDLLADRTAAITGFERQLREAIDGFLARCRALPDAQRAGDAFLRHVPGAYRLHVWATQAAQAGYIDTHIHEDSWLSGAYYVTLPDAIADEDPAHAGWIEFGRPYAHLRGWPEHAVRTVRPRVGTLLLFPSYLFHRTLPYTGPGERISISFDLAAR